VKEYNCSRDKNESYHINCAKRLESMHKNVHETFKLNGLHCLHLTKHSAHKTALYNYVH